MQEALIDLGLRRAGYSSLSAFAGAVGAANEELALERLMPWLLGYDLWRVRAGDTFSKIARETGATVSALEVANRGLEPENLPLGRYLVVPMDFPVVPEDIPYTWQLTHYVLRGLQARYPFVQVETVGQSLGGRPLERVRLGQGQRRVYYNGAHHANEWITVPTLLGCLEQYARAVAFDLPLENCPARELYQAATLYLLPLVNPDGVDLVNGAATAQEQAAALEIAGAYPDIPYPQGWKANLRGVDLNLNYPAQWEQARQIKYQLGFTGPAPRDYVGPEPLSEPESRCMLDTTGQLDPALTIAWHTQGREIYWEFLDIQPGGARELGREMAAASGYALASVAYASGFGGYKDWFIQDFRRPGYTIEAGSGENPLPLAQLPRLLRDNLPIFLLGLSGGWGEVPIAPTGGLAAGGEGKALPAPAGGLQRAWG